MNDNSVNFPYPLGTYFSKIEDGITHIDQLHEYIINQYGICVVLTLDALTDPRLSTRIDMDIFVNNWTEVKNVDIVSSKQR